MDKLKVDTQSLRDTAAALKLIKTEFDDANANSDTLADAVGEPGLASRVRDFAQNWDMRRKDMVDKIATLEKNISDGADALDKTDKQLGDSLTDNR
jgi:hypothetical protein